MMKRITLIVFVLATLIVTALAVPANNSHDVYGTYLPGPEESIIYSVDITWGAMEFEYTPAFVGTWFPTTHYYKDSKEAKWTATGNTITIINHSNTAVEAELTYTQKPGFALTGNFGKDTINLASAVGTTRINAPTASTTLTISGELDDSVTTKTAIGSITIEFQ